MNAVRKFFGLGRQCLETGGLVDGVLSGFIEHGMHQRGSDDDTVGIGADSRTLLGGGDTNADADILRTGIARTCHQLLRRSVNGGTFTGDAHTGGCIDETTGIVGNDLQTTVGGIR